MQDRVDVREDRVLGDEVFPLPFRREGRERGRAGGSRGGVRHPLSFRRYAAPSSPLKRRGKIAIRLPEPRQRPIGDVVHPLAGLGVAITGNKLRLLQEVIGRKAING